jgi:hypothetical protein
MRSAQRSTSPRQTRARKQALSPQMRQAQTRSAPKRNTNSLDVLSRAVFISLSSPQSRHSRESGNPVAPCVPISAKTLHLATPLPRRAFASGLCCFALLPGLPSDLILGDGAPKSAVLWLRICCQMRRAPLGAPIAAVPTARQSRRFQHRASLLPLEAGSNSVSSSVSQLLAGPPIESGRSSDAAREPAVRQPARRRRTSSRFMNAS